MKIISAFIRVFIIPNPFESLGVWADAVNYLTEGLLHTFTYNIVGLFYKRNSAPALGSLLYLIVYWVHVMILSLLGAFSWRWWAIAIAIALYIAILWFLLQIKDFISRFF